MQPSQDSKEAQPQQQEQGGNNERPGQPPPYHQLPPPYYASPPLFTAPFPFQDPYYGAYMMQHVALPPPMRPTNAPPGPPPLVIVLFGLPKTGCSTIGAALAADLRFPFVSAAAVLKRDKEAAEGSPHHTVYSSHTWGQAQLLVTELERALCIAKGPERGYSPPPPSGLILDWTPWNADEFLFVIHWLEHRGFPLAGAIRIDPSPNTADAIEDEGGEQSPVMEMDQQESPFASNKESQFYADSDVLQRILSSDSHYLQAKGTLTESSQKHWEAVAHRKLARSAAAQRELLSLLRILNIPHFSVHNAHVPQEDSGDAPPSWLSGVVGKVKGTLARLRAQRSSSSPTKEVTRVSTDAIESNPLASGSFKIVAEEKEPGKDAKQPAWYRTVKNVEEFSAVMDVVARALHRCGVKEKKTIPTGPIHMQRESWSSVLHLHEKKKKELENDTPETSPVLHPTPAVTVEEEDALLLRPWLRVHANEPQAESCLLVAMKKWEPASANDSSLKKSPELAVYLVPHHQQCIFAVVNPSAVWPFKLDAAHVSILHVVLCSSVDLLLHRKPSEQHGKDAGRTSPAVILIEDVTMWDGRNLVNKSYHSRMRPLYHALHHPAAAGATADKRKHYSKPNFHHPIISLPTSNDELEAILWGDPHQGSNAGVKIVILRAVPLGAIADRIPSSPLTEAAASAMWKLTAAHGLAAFHSRTTLKDAVHGIAVSVWKSLSDVSFHFQLGSLESDDSFALLSWQLHTFQRENEAESNDASLAGGAGELTKIPISACTLKAVRRPFLHVGDIVEVRPEILKNDARTLQWHFLRRGSQRTSPDTWSVVEQCGFLATGESASLVLRDFESFYPILQAAAHDHSAVSQLRDMLERQHPQAHA